MRHALAPKAAVVEEDTAAVAGEDKVEAAEDTVAAVEDKVAKVVAVADTAEAGEDRVEAVGVTDKDRRVAITSNHRHSTYTTMIV